MSDLQQFIDSLTGVAPGTRRGYVGDAEQHVAWLTAHDCEPQSISRDTLARYPRWLAARYRPATVARKLSVVRRFYASLCAEVGDALQTPEMASRPGHATQWSQIPLPELLDPTGRGFRDRAILALAVLHHLPAAAISRLTWREMDIAQLPGLLRYRGDLVTMSATSYTALTGWQRACEILQIANRSVFVTLHNERHPLSARGVRAVINKYQPTGGIRCNK